MAYTTIRQHMTSALRPLALTLDQLGNTNQLYEDLKDGEDVTLTPDLLRYVADHPSYPEDLDAFDEWTLSGDNSLTGVA